MTLKRIIGIITYIEERYPKVTVEFSYHSKQTWLSLSSKKGAVTYNHIELQIKTNDDIYKKARELS